MAASFVLIVNLLPFKGVVLPVHTRFPAYSFSSPLLNASMILPVVPSIFDGTMIGVPVVEFAPVASATESPVVAFVVKPTLFTVALSPAKAFSHFLIKVSVVSVLVKVQTISAPAAIPVLAKVTVPSVLLTVTELAPIPVHTASVNRYPVGIPDSVKTTFANDRLGEKYWVMPDVSVSGAAVVMEWFKIPLFVLAVKSNFPTPPRLIFLIVKLGVLLTNVQVISAPPVISRPDEMVSVDPLKSPNSPIFPVIELLASVHFAFFNT